MFLFSHNCGRLPLDGALVFEAVPRKRQRVGQRRKSFFIYNTIPSEPCVPIRAQHRKPRGVDRQGTMNIFLHIFWNNVLPLALVIGAGILLQRLFSLDIRTFSKLLFYLFSPVFLFRLLLETEISGQVLGQVVLFLLVFQAAQFVLAELIARLRGMPNDRRVALRNGTMFYNAANYGIPLNQLVFRNDPYTLAVQLLIMLSQQFLTNTLGIYSINARRAGWRQAFRVILSLPIIYAIPLALVIRAADAQLPSFLYTSINYVADAFFGVALFTLGAQLGNMPWRFSRREALDVSVASALRLAAGPALAWLTTLLLGIDGLLAAALIVSSAAPTSLYSMLIAVEFKNEPEFATQTVLVSTLLSMVTVTLVIQLLGLGVG